MGYETNAKRGTISHYGPRSTDEKFGGKYRTDGETETVEWVFSYDDLPAASTSALAQSIPANSFIESARIVTTTPFAGGTSYNFGLAEADGTVIDADGIDAAVAAAAMSSVGETVLCDGALVQATAGIGSAAGQLTVAATGTYTAGEARVIIKYRPV